MQFSLPAEIQQRVDAHIATGVFASETEVLREALDSLERRQRGLSQLRRLVAMAEEDLAAGRVAPFDRAEIKNDVRNSFAERGIRD